MTAVRRNRSTNNPPEAVKVALSEVTGMDWPPIVFAAGSAIIAAVAALAAWRSQVHAKRAADAAERAARAAETSAHADVRIAEATEKAAFAAHMPLVDFDAQRLPSGGSAKECLVVTCSGANRAILTGVFFREDGLPEPGTDDGRTLTQGVFAQIPLPPEVCKTAWGLASGLRVVTGYITYRDSANNSWRQGFVYDLEKMAVRADSPKSDRKP